MKKKKLYTRAESSFTLSDLVIFRSMCRETRVPLYIHTSPRDFGRWKLWTNRNFLYRLFFIRLSFLVYFIVYFLARWVFHTAVLLLECSTYRTTQWQLISPSVYFSLFPPSVSSFCLPSSTFPTSSTRQLLDSDEKRRNYGEAKRRKPKKPLPRLFRILGRKK